MGAGRVFINNMWRAGMRIVLRILLIFKKIFFSKKDVKFSFWRKGSEIFFCAKYTIFFQKIFIIEKRIA